jgi:hypothetical protein
MECEGVMMRCRFPAPSRTRTCHPEEGAAQSLPDDKPCAPTEGPCRQTEGPAPRRGAGPSVLPSRAAMESSAAVTGGNAQLQHHPPNCHFEGAPRRTIPRDGPGARLRNLLSASSWPVASPALAPSGCCAPARPERLPHPASRDPRVDSSALPRVARKSGCSAAGPRNDSPVCSAGAHGVARHHITALPHRATAIPHGRVPTRMVPTTRSVRVSMTDRSFDSPLAV